MANSTPILPRAAGAIVDAQGNYTVIGRELQRKIVERLQGQIDQLSATDGNIIRILESLTGPDGQLLDLSGINVGELAAIAGVQSPGLMVRDALGQWFGRAATGTAGRVSVTFGDGIGGNPTFDIDAGYAGQASITTLGTVTTGAWHAGVVGEAYGGTGQATYTVGDLLYASGAAALSKLAAGTVNYVLTSNGPGAAPAWMASSGGGSTGGAIGCTFDGGGAVLTPGTVGRVPVNFAGTIAGALSIGDQTGSLVVSVWKDSYANYPPTAGDNIAGSTPPTITGAIKAHDTTLTGWTTSFVAGDIFFFTVVSCSGITSAVITLEADKT